MLTATNRCTEDTRFTRDRIKILTATNRCREDTVFTREREKERDRDIVYKDTDSNQ